MIKNEGYCFTLVCLEDWQGAYIDGLLIDQGHEVNVIDIINLYENFANASWEYLDFPEEEDFDEFLDAFGGEMPVRLSDLKEWRE